MSFLPKIQFFCPAINPALLDVMAGVKDLMFESKEANFILLPHFIFIHLRLVLVLSTISFVKNLQS
jgi:hypothetical protein